MWASSDRSESTVLRPRLPYSSKMSLEGVTGPKVPPHANVVFHFGLFAPHAFAGAVAAPRDRLLLDENETAFGVVKGSGLGRRPFLCGVKKLCGCVDIVRAPRGW